MDNEDLATESVEFMSAETAASTAVHDTPLNSSIADYSLDDEDLDEAAVATAAEATRDMLADGLVARLLRPCVDRLDASVQCTRLSQLDLKLQLDSLAAELKQLSLMQHDYLFSTSSISSPQTPVSTVLSTVTNKTTTDTSVLLDGYARRLCDARAKIAVVGNILESTQERLRALSHRIGREHNNRRSLLEPQIVVTNVTEKSKLEEDADNNKLEEIEGNEENQQLPNYEKEEPQHLMDDVTRTISQSESETPSL